MLAHAVLPLLGHTRLVLTPVADVTTVTLLAASSLRAYGLGWVQRSSTAAAAAVDEDRSCLLLC
jgi:hypothetical protein